MAEAEKTSSNNTTVVSESAPKARRFFNLPIVVLGLLMIAGLIVLVKLVFFPPTFKTITYYNGQGKKMSLKFYRKYYLSADFTSTKQADAAKVAESKGGGLVGLASKKSVNSKYPIWFGVLVQNLNPRIKDIYEHNHEIPCLTKTVFVIRVTSLKQNVPICENDLTADRPAYIGTFINIPKQKSLMIVVTQVGTTKQLADPNSKLSTGLADYKTDLTTIINSITLLN